MFDWIKRYAEPQDRRLGRSTLESGFRTGGPLTPELHVRPRPSAGEFILLKPVRQKAGKLVHAYAVEGDLDTDTMDSNTFEIEIPPRSSQLKTFPEIDRAAWYALTKARQKINPAQIGFLDELEERIEKESAY